MLAVQKVMSIISKSWVGVTNLYFCKWYFASATLSGSSLGSLSPNNKYADRGVCCYAGVNVQPQGANISPTLIVIGPYDTTVAGQVLSPLSSMLTKPNLRAAHLFGFLICVLIATVLYSRQHCEKLVSNRACFPQAVAKSECRS